ncbi:hypothetical protein Q1695_010817 [Nippostrongylus brasiliensis]|nr:hypothetical protein Q1695_010817 [Nippostrongylus brasiliensis]
MEVEIHPFSTTDVRKIQHIKGFDQLELEMVCLPCIFLPVLLAIYLKFIQPYVYRILPQRWVEFLDPILYPTCPAKPPAPEASGGDTKGEQENRASEACCAGVNETKKDL